MNDDMKEELKDCYAEIERLRADGQKAALDYLGQIGQLSDEVTRLRAALEWIVGCALTEPKEMVDKARAALEGKHD